MSSNKWVQHVKRWAQAHKMSYTDALKHPQCKNDYSSMRSDTEGKGLRAVARKMHGGSGRRSGGMTEERFFEVLTYRVNALNEVINEGGRVLQEYFNLTGRNRQQLNRMDAYTANEIDRRAVLLLGRLRSIQETYDTIYEDGSLTLQRKIDMIYAVEENLALNIRNLKAAIRQFIERARTIVPAA